MCDRKKELTWLLNQIKNERNIVLFSLRRLGKTALIQHLLHHFSDHKLGKTVYVDLLGTEDLQQANTRIANAIVRQIGKPGRRIPDALADFASKIGASIGFDPITRLPQITFALQAQPDAKTTFDALGAYLGRLPDKVLICLDEFQQITNYPEGSAEADFRAWAQEYPGIRFLFSGSHRQMMHSMFSESTRPFYRSAQILELQPLPQDEYRAFIRNFFTLKKREIPDEVIDEIFHWSRMQTFCVQLVCNKLYGMRGNPNMQILRAVFDDLIQQDLAYFSQWQQFLTSLQWRVLCAIAIDGEVEAPTSSDFLKKHNLGAASSVSAALATLVDKELVYYQQTYYAVHDVIFMRWLQSIR